MIDDETKEIPKAYDPSLVEDKWYEYWLNNKIFKSEVDDTKEPYTIVIPPPNITGMLTMGHILNNTLQD
ncbi:MAG: class I tRNA ligase family protein, partial [Ignavibacteriaceae bacterium]|nr:class I tRNA ligase family protein [Ignavibacteriaceae bacterium]